MKELICIVCPKGCHLKVDDKNGYTVIGNSCPRGENYGKTELLNPTRVITSTVMVNNGTHRRCSVKTNIAIPKSKINEIMQLINSLEFDAPIKVGQVFAENICGTSAKIIATRDMEVCHAS